MKLNYDVCSDQCNKNRNEEPNTKVTKRREKQKKASAIAIARQQVQFWGRATSTWTNKIAKGKGHKNNSK